MASSHILAHAKQRGADSAAPAYFELLEPAVASRSECSIIFKENALFRTVFVMSCCYFSPVLATWFLLFIPIKYQESINPSFLYLKDIFLFSFKFE